MAAPPKRAALGSMAAHFPLLTLLEHLILNLVAALDSWKDLKVLRVTCRALQHALDALFSDGAMMQLRHIVDLPTQSVSANSATCALLRRLQRLVIHDSGNVDESSNGKPAAALQRFGAACLQEMTSPTNLRFMVQPMQLNQPFPSRRVCRRVHMIRLLHDLPPGLRELSFLALSSSGTDACGNAEAGAMRAVVQQTAL